ncbi:DNA/RNA helicase domain-containing protein [Microbacterium nanhaiense]|uniref:DNA/RNA helicase domain-containing protein n=1 Tax=Microbacterium nanhaiense TaxID=1301026 RepID=UPI00227D2790|nr:DNA/RNA helicase domain-containing protein [Microbacterium nanhaiense]
MGACAHSSGDARKRCPVRGWITYTDHGIERYVKNVYAVLLARGIRGTFVYVCDDALRSHLRELLPSAE